MGLFGGSKTYVTNTGLQDAQMTTLTGNQKNLETGLNDVNTNLNTGFASIDTGFEGVNTGITGLATDIAGINDGITTSLDAGLTNFSDLMTLYNTGINTQFEAVNTGLSNNATALESVNTGLTDGITGLQTGQDTGFAAMGGRFDTVDQSNIDMQTSVDEGFQDQAQGFTDVNANISTGFADNETAVNTGFVDAAAAMDQGFGDASTQLTDTQANVLEGQQGLGTTLDTMGATADAYASQSLTNQDAIQAGQDSYVSNFDTYVDRYDDDTALAQTTRSDMQIANAGANQALRQDMAKTAYIEEVKAAEIARNVEAIQIGQIKNAAIDAASNQSLDQGIRQNFANLGTSFDANGALIPTTADSAGNRIVRSMDNQGNLILNSFNSLGQPVGSQTINIAQSLNILNQVSNAIPADTGNGLASPYMTT